MKYPLLLALIFILFLPAHSQSLIKSFIRLSCPEKMWVISHPFIAKKARDISIEARDVSEALLKDTVLDGDKCGGQVDAFRHAFWMALLVREIKQKKAYRLGLSHEKGNKKMFKKNRTEEGDIPDAKSCKMDLLNNDIGIRIGIESSDESEEKLVEIIKKAVLNGELWIISKDSAGNFLDCKGNVLKKEDYSGRWENEKCLVRSDNKFRE